MSAEFRPWGMGYTARGTSLHALCSVPGSGGTTTPCPRPQAPGPARGSIGSLVIAGILLLATTGCEWFTDFKRQPHVVTWESWRADSLGVRGQPQGSVPMDGTAVPSWMVSYSPTMATIDSMAGIPNPIPITEASLANGRKYFQINCAVCHGSNGDGQTPNGRYGIIPIPLTGDLTRQRTDGYIFGMIRNGRNTMPSYNRVEERDRWDVVNYVRALQGLVTSVPFERGPLALPGVNGEMVPGPTTLGPNRNVPWRPSAPDSAARPGQGGAR